MTKSISKINLHSRTILLIADIHANLPALDAVIACRHEGEPVLCAGDMVGYYSEPNEVCERLREIGAFVVRGNHDAYIIGALEPNPANREKYRVDWTRNKLTASNIGWLEGLPQTIECSLLCDEPSETNRMIVRHANPLDEERYLYPDSDLSEFPLPSGTLMLVGHTHHPMLRKAGDGAFINPGSVGQPRNRKPGAAYARFDMATGTVSFHSAAYDIASYQKHLRSQAVSEDVVQFLSRSVEGS